MDANTVLLIVSATTSILWGASELLALIPSVKANSVFQAVYNVVKAISGK